MQRLRRRTHITPLPGTSGGLDSWGTALGKAVSLHCMNTQICKALQRAHLCARQPEGVRTHGVYLLQFIEQCFYGLEKFWCWERVAALVTLTLQLVSS